jgi:uncharacterized protein (DUF952 family)
VSTIYHITTRANWEKAKSAGEYIDPSLAIEGFIHCSLADQVNGVLQRYFAGQSDLVKLEIETSLLTSELKYEWAASVSDNFPHVYGPINLDAVQQVHPVKAPSLPE